MSVELLKAIPRGKKNAISCIELEAKTGIEARAIKSKISYFRQNGAVICSSLDDNGGYFYPADASELEEYVITQQKRIDTAQAALNPAIKRLRKVTGNNERTANSSY